MRGREEAHESVVGTDIELETRTNDRKFHRKRPTVKTFALVAQVYFAKRKKTAVYIGRSQFFSP